MSDISNIEIAVLGLLYEHHHYANRLEEIMELRSMHKWVDLKYPSVENVLEELKEKDLVENEVRKFENQTSKKVYSITKKGKLVFREKIKELLSTKSNLINPIDLAIANIQFLSQDEINESLNAYRKSIEERIIFIDQSIRIQEEKGVPYNFIAILSHSKALLKAESKWIEDFIKNMEN